jgi:hypothetical protein
VTSHRGPDPADALDLGVAAQPTLCSAVADLSWLLERGYSETAAVKLVGDRYALRRRQRAALARSACAETLLAGRRSREVSLDDLADMPVDIDGFNVLITLERALSGGPILVGRDGACRDLGGVHGTWRAVEETPVAIAAVARALASFRAGPVRWLLDAPISNSGRLAALLRQTSDQQGLGWDVQVDPRPDAVLAVSAAVVATSDAWILDHCSRWVNLARGAIDGASPETWWVDLRSPTPEGSA